MADDYKVGYGKPPKRNQFKKGQSGNPKGRRKGAQNVKTVLRNELSEKVVIMENGKKKTVTKLEAVVKSVTARGAQGDAGAAIKLINLFQGVVGEEGENVDDTGIAASDAEILNNLKKRIIRDHGNGNASPDDSEDPDDSEGS